MVPERLHSITLSRRSLLKAAGVTAGAIALSPLALRFTRGASSSDALTVGVLLPHSRLHADLGSNLLAGLQLAFADTHARPVQLLVEEYGVLPTAAAAAGGRLIDDQQVDMLVGVVSTSAIALLAPLLEERQVPLIATTAGANVVRPAAENAYVFHNTLGHWQASRGSGTWAVAHGGRRAFIAASFHDSGYDALEAFRAGFEEAGGEVVGSQITHVPGTALDLNTLMSVIAQEKPDVVYAAYAGSEAVDFFRAYADAGFATGATLLANTLTAPDRPDIAITRVGSWSAALNTPLNNRFQQEFAAAAGRPADAFAALGYDTGQLIARTSEKGEPLRAALANSRVIGVRGELAFDQTSQFAPSRLYVSELSSAGERLIDEVPSTSSLVHYAATLRDGLKTGWLNAYLCV